MHRVHGRVVVQETGEGVRDLTIVVLDVEREALSRLRPGGLVGQSVSALIVPGVRRLGSVVTDGAGRFSLEANAKDGLRTLVLLATAPETAGKGGCPRIIHVSCDARTDPGLREAFLVTIPATTLRDAGVSRLGLRAPVPGADPAVEKVRRAWREQEPPAARISARYRQRRDALRPPLDRRAPNGLRLAGGVVLAGAGEGQLEFDAGHWFLTRGDERSELSFAGAVSAADAGPAISAPGRLTAEVDAAGRRFRLVVPTMSFHLQEATTGPGDLWHWRLAHRSTPAAAPVSVNGGGGPRA